MTIPQPPQTTSPWWGSVTRSGLPHMQAPPQDGRPLSYLITLASSAGYSLAGQASGPRSSGGGMRYFTGCYPEDRI